VRSALGGHPAAEGTFRVCRGDVDDAAHRLTAVERRLSAAQYLDPRQVARQQILEIELAARLRRIVDLHAVDDHDGLIALGPADEHRGGLTDSAGARDAQAGGGGEKV
jgi:hypothetical protein